MGLDILLVVVSVWQAICLDWLGSFDLWHASPLSESSLDLIVDTVDSLKVLNRTPVDSGTGHAIVGGGPLGISEAGHMGVVEHLGSP